MKDPLEIKKRLIEAGYVAIDELIRIAESPIFSDHKEVEEKETKETKNTSSTKTKAPKEKVDLSADRMKNAASAKKVAIFDAFEILQKVQSEQTSLDELKKMDSNGGASKPMASPENRGNRPR